MAARHRPNKLSRWDLEFLLSERSDAHAEGQILWYPQPAESAVVGKLLVDVSVATEGVTRVEAGFNFVRPDVVTLKYIVNNVSAFRICVNRMHRPFRGTHCHKYVPASGEEKNQDYPDFSPIPRQAVVAEGTWRRVFEDFANLVNVQLPEGYWTNPEGGQDENHTD